MQPPDEQPPRIRIAPLRYRLGEIGTDVSRPGPPAPAARSRRPIATIALLVVIVVTTAIEFALARSTDPSPAMLMALGGMNATAVQGGDWYRLITAALLHGGILHLVFNGVALFLGGAIVESLAGRSWLIVIAVLSAVTGSALGCVINDPSIVSVGASGSIMGILAAGMVLAFRLPHGPHRNQLLGLLARFLIPSLLPLATSASEGRIDYSAHIGGAIGGAAIGAVILFAKLFDRPKTAGALAVVAISLVAASVGVEAKHFPAESADAMLDAKTILVPDSEIPKDWHEAARTVDVWGKDRPRDPRVHLFRAMRIVDESSSRPEGSVPPEREKAERDDEERELRLALSEKALFHKFFGDRKLETTIRIVLCTLLTTEGRDDEAHAEAAPVCDAGDGRSAPPELARLGLCPDHR